MRIAYLSNSPLKQAPANAVHVMRMCASMVDLGHSVVLFARKGGRSDPESLYSQYGRVPGFDIRFFEYSRLKGFRVLLYALVQGFRSAMLESADIVYGRCIPSVVVALALGKPAIIELHEIPSSRWLRLACRYVLRHKRLVRGVVISAALLEDLRSTFPEESSMVEWVVAHDGADPVADIRPFELKRRGNLNVGYAGGLRSGNGIHLILGLAQDLPDVSFHIVGGPDSLIEHWVSTDRRTPTNVHWYGRLAPIDVPPFLVACDVLVAPYVDGPKTSGGRDTSRWMSPLKVFEYLASGRAIIVSDLPVLREVLNDEIACLVPADDIVEWRAALMKLQDRSFRERMGEDGRQHFIDRFTWKARAAMVLAELQGQGAAAGGS